MITRSAEVTLAEHDVIRAVVKALEKRRTLYNMPDEKWVPTPEIRVAFGMSPSYTQKALELLLARRLVRVSIWDGRTNCYQLTAKGWRVFNAHLAEAERVTSEIAENLRND